MPYVLWMKAIHNRLAHILHHRLNNGDVSLMLRRWLIAVAVGIGLVFTLCVMLAWGVRG